MNPLPGFRDFYPEALAVRRYIFDKWRDVARRYAPIDIDTVVPVTLTYEAGNLFGGHGVAVEVDDELQFQDIDLRG